MPISDILEKRIQYRIKKSKDFVFMLPDFLDWQNYSPNRFG